MNKTTLWTLLLVVLVAIIGGYMLFAKQAAAPTTETPVSEELPPAGVGVPSEDSVSLVSYTDSGFSPQTVTVSVGDTVRFTNTSSTGMWVGVDEHPTHTEYDGTSTKEHCVDGSAIGGTFDACRPYTSGESYEFTFTRAGTFEYHNHVGSSKTGTVIVR
ncbi:hypothetical protein KKD81_02575 [Patescibacteria group bacterium]|nr:hypothetical protein [Patescibacteria group bacterium]MBU2158587.1 hypothetical protein [Patescibacteria group bacterium]MBU2220798.1 hypothetical protein [Patescibacteria group bacterium]